MLSFWQSVYSKKPTKSTQKIANFVLKLRGIKFQKLEADKQQAYFQKVMEHLANFAEKEVRQFSQKNPGKLELHWNMIKKSNFNPSLYQKYAEVEEFFGATLKLYMAGHIQNLSKKINQKLNS